MRLTISFSLQNTSVGALRTLRTLKKIEFGHTTARSLNHALSQAIGVPVASPPTLKSFALVKKLAITPTRTVFLESVAMAKNRVIRQFPEENSFLLVDFTDEEGQLIRGGDHYVLAKVRNTLV